MTKTLVTGAAGFTGRYVALALAERGHEVHGLVHFQEQKPIPEVAQVHEADLVDLQAVRRIVDEVRPDHVIHLAAISNVAHDDVEQIYRSNVVGTRQLLESFVRGKRPPTTILLASSANVYGNAREGVLDEDVPPAPANDYGVSKLAMEYVAKLYSSRLPIVVVRPFNYTGIGQSTNFLLPKIVAHVREGAPFVELGNLDVARDFSDVRTVADAYARLLETPQALGGTYNVCSGQAVSLKSLLEIVGRLSAREIEIRVNPALVRANEVRTLCGSAAKLERVIGRLKTIPPEETLGWMLQA
jgi:GDP-6-deoxy-D-talose 4-dehydrogenase